VKRVFAVSVTYEFPTAAPETVKGEFVGGSPQKAASQALRLARTRFPGRRPSSIVVVLEMEREA
jgi:hypothetical protein